MISKGEKNLPTSPIDALIYNIRDIRVILDTDLARIYGIPTFRLNEAVKRNRDRFPEDFMFRLTKNEFGALTSQNAMSKTGRGGRRTLPYAFTEYGAIMAANILNCPRAVEMSVFVVRAFIKMRQTLSANKVLSEKLHELEGKLAKRLDVHERAIAHIIDEIRRLMGAPPLPVKKPKSIGFKVRESRVSYKTIKRKRGR